MVVMSMTDCVNNTCFFLLWFFMCVFLGGGRSNFFIFVLYFIGGRGVYQKHERQYLTLSYLSSWIPFVSLKRSGLF